MHANTSNNKTRYEVEDGTQVYNREGKSDSIKQLAEELHVKYAKSQAGVLEHYREST